MYPLTTAEDDPDREHGVRLKRPPLRPRRQHVSDRRRRGWWKRKLGRGSRSQKAGASS